MAFVGYKSVITPLIVQYPFTDTATLALHALMSRVCKSGYSTLRGDITITQSFLLYDALFPKSACVARALTPFLQCMYHVMLQ